MNNSENASPRSPLIRLPFLILVLVLGVGGYFAGPTIMTQLMYQQERMKVENSSAIPHEFNADGPRPSIPGMGGDGGGQDNANQGEAAASAFDPESLFAERDSDQNGVLEGDEISGRMRDGLERIDADGDGAVSKEEFLAASSRRQSERESANSNTENGAESSDDRQTESGATEGADPSSNGSSAVD